MRLRETITGSLTSHTAVIESKPSSGSVWSPYGSAPYGERHRKAILDTDTPNFHTLLKCGNFLPLNEAWINDELIKIEPGTVNCTLLSGGGVDYRGKSAGVEGFPVGFLPTPNLALTEAAVLAAAANCVGEAWDVLTFMAEFRNSVATMSSVGRRFNSLTNGLALRALKKARKNPGLAYRYFQELWLEARYGVRPMIYDYYDAAKALDKLLSGKTRNLVTGRGSETETLGNNLSGWVSYDVNWEVNLEFTLSGQFIHRGIAYMIPSTLSESAFRANILTTAWELLPYSFVVDWFIGIGSWVQTLTPSLTGQFAGIGKSLKHDYTITSQRKYRVKAGMGSGTWDNALYTRRLKLYERSPAGIAFPSPLPRLTLPKVVDLVTLFLNGRRDVANTLGNQRRIRR